MKLMKNIVQTTLLLLVVSITMAFAEIDRSFSRKDKEIDQFYGNAASERGSSSQYESLASLRKNVQEVDQRPPNETIPLLADGLQKLARKNVFQVAERIEVYDLVQSTLLAIPGHAKYFVDELERLRIDPKSDYIRTRATYLTETLKHLPSPETIQVLGHYLSDMRDTPYDENPKYIAALRAGKVKEPDWTPTPQNAWLATYTLSNIGLRNPPFAPVGNYINIRFSEADSLPKFRAWWEEVKSGKRTFSFVGHKAEYRFKPDGGWEIVTVANPPDKTPKLPDAPPLEQEKKSEKEPLAKPRPEEKIPAAHEGSEHAMWKWALAGFFLLIVAGLWSKLRKA
ncbi:MAG: hypothetical protein ABIT37_12685 [Luteolibacter sp.]